MLSSWSEASVSKSDRQGCIWHISMTGPVQDFDASDPEVLRVAIRATIKAFGLVSRGWVFVRRLPDRQGGFTVVKEGLITATARPSKNRLELALMCDVKPSGLQGWAPKLKAAFERVGIRPSNIVVNDCSVSLAPPLLEQVV